MREIDRTGELRPHEIDALLFAGGSRPNRSAFKLAAQRSKHIVAIDGGLRHLRSLAVVPEVVIGDFDSAKPEDITWARRRRAHIVFSADQETSDMDKALAMCRERKWKNVVIACADGSRPDHFLYALSKTLSQRGTSFTFLFRNSVLRTLSGKARVRLRIGRGRVFSWIGFAVAEGANLEFAQWPICSGTLEYGKFSSLSNIASADVVDFSQVSGRSLIIIPTGKA